MRFVAIFASSPSLAKVRLAEFIAVARALHVDITILDSFDCLQDDESNVFCVFDSNGDGKDEIEKKMKKIASRCILLRGIYVLLQGASTLEALTQWRLDRACGAPNSEVASTVLLGEDEDQFSHDSFCYEVETIGKKYSMDEKKKIVDFFISQRSTTNGSPSIMNWKSPTHRFLIFIQHSVSDAPPRSQGQWRPDGPVQRAFHVVQLFESNRSQMLGKYDLKKRPYIGTTSMPPEEAIAMANVCSIQPADYVCDPFCGTGSLLVSAAHCGAHTIGMDADGRAMRSGSRKVSSSLQMQQQRKLALSAYSEEELSALTAEERLLPSMKSNFTLYGLRPPECVRMNFSSWKCCFRGIEIFDVILTDPPYGLREPRKRLEKVDHPSSSDDPNDSKDGSSKFLVSSYSTHEVGLDLVLFAAEHLRVGGRLAFWFPTTDHYTRDELARHPCLELEYDLPQRLSLKVVRRLIVMRKVAPLPKERPTREECMPLKIADDLRQLMDITSLPDNKDYMHYRAKVLRKRQASSRFHSKKESGLEIQELPQATTEENSKEVDGAQRQQMRRSDEDYKDHNRRRDKPISQETIVANREKNIRIRKEKQEASHRVNANASAHVSQTRDRMYMPDHQ
ncbi:unnamed protein product [Phytomonas sp. EM1]|nr:unnamed protein product [Phytomonas sp. EM1]|eukprot:CCW61294.1 unnamed protein product [Phytomonas sp. isolate EM1]